jgi:hypothetical protein
MKTPFLESTFMIIMRPNLNVNQMPMSLIVEPLSKVTIAPE